MRWVVGLVIAVFGLLTFYSIVNPHSNIFVPKCMFRLLTGYDCPACGIQRSLHALLNGDTVTVLRYNYFLLISIPYFFSSCHYNILEGRFNCENGLLCSTSESCKSNIGVDYNMVGHAKYTIH